MVEEVEQEDEEGYDASAFSHEECKNSAAAAAALIFFFYLLHQN